MKQVDPGARPAVRNDGRRRVQRRVRRLRAGGQRRPDHRLPHATPQDDTSDVHQACSRRSCAGSATGAHVAVTASTRPGRRRAAADRRARVDDRRLRSRRRRREDLRGAAADAGGDRRAGQRDQRGAADGGRRSTGRACSRSTSPTAPRRRPSRRHSAAPSRARSRRPTAASRRSRSSIRARRRRRSPTCSRSRSARRPAAIVRLGDVAHLRYAPAPLLITRENRATVIHVSANVAPGSNLSDVTRDVPEARARAASAEERDASIPPRRASRR